MNPSFWHQLIRSGILAVGQGHRRSTRGILRRRFQPQVQGLECRTLPTTLTVMNTNDSGAGSLRAALAQASDGDTINFDPGLSGQTINLTSGALMVQTSVIIQGLGPDQLTIDGSRSVIFGVFDTNSAITVAISGLTLTDGDTGVAVDTMQDVQISLTDCSVSGNSYGITADETNSSHRASVSLDGCSVSNNDVDGVFVSDSTSLIAVNSIFDNNGEDGIIYSSVFIGTNSSIMLDQCTFSANQGQGFSFDGFGTVIAENCLFEGNKGGGVAFNGGDDDGSLSITDSTIRDNGQMPPSGGGALFGGGIDAVGEGYVTVNLTRITVSGNRAMKNPQGLAGYGGGIYLGDAIGNITDCTVSGNLADNGGGSLFVEDSTQNVSGGVLSVTGSTFSGNNAGDGGGLYFSYDPRYSSPTAQFTNDTISGNTATRNGGGLYNTAANFPGAGPDSSNLPMFLNCTFGNNQAAQGGGIYTAVAPLYLENTLVGTNQAPIGPDLSGAVNSLGHNLFGNSSGGGGYVSSDILDMDPMLGPLQDNGGPTYTQALLAGSPAIDKADANAPPTDQRGVGRYGPPDIGAYEYVPGMNPAGRSAYRSLRESAAASSLVIGASPRASEGQSGLVGPEAARSILLVLPDLQRDFSTWTGMGEKTRGPNGVGQLIERWHGSLSPAEVEGFFALWSDYGDVALVGFSSVSAQP